jgi:predicted unusual protein kinase regulating ubiquinone biosynthesis (AarF/ABC1/UbiB family)
MRDGIRELLIGLGTRDAARTTKAYKLMGILLPSANVDLLEQAESEVFDRFWGKSMDELKQVGFQEAHDFAIRFRDLLYDLPFQVPEDLILIGRTVGILSGMCTGLDPAFNVWNEMIPYARKFIEEDATGNRVSWLSEIGVYLQRLLTLPQRTESVLERLERGEMEVRDRGLSMQVGRVERTVRRAGGAVLAGALVLAGVQMFLAGYPVPAWILWAAAAVTVLWSLL